ncbi:MAG: hypothetical protein NDI60_01740 [Elusimicrobiales bacterium]|nr:hypothetical protein [Elusimicrobiales bacterium]
MKIKMLMVLVLAAAAACSKQPQQVSEDKDFNAAVAELEKAVTPADRFYALNAAEVTAMDAGNIDAARAYAAEHAALLPKFAKNWNYGNAVQDINQTLGRIALREKNFAAAGDYLIKSAQGGGSPQLNSFGPNFQLAKELLEAGQREPVRQYLELCGKFWKMDRGSLAHWLEVMKAGGTPDFHDHYTRGYEKK